MCTFLIEDVKPAAKMVESLGFMNALSTQAAKMKEKKVKKVSGKGTKARTNSTGSGPVESKHNSGTKDEKGAEPMEGKLPAPALETKIELQNVVVCTMIIQIYLSGIAEEASQDMAEVTEGSESSKKKKRVSWASADNLTKFFYFELDESERGTSTVCYFSTFLKLTGGGFTQAYVTIPCGSMGAW